MSMYASPPPPLPPHSHYYGYPGYDVYAPAPVQRVYWGRLCLVRVRGTTARRGGPQGRQGQGWWVPPLQSEEEGEGPRRRGVSGGKSGREQPPPSSSLQKHNSRRKKKTPPVARAVGCGVRVDRGFCESWWAGARERRRRGDGTGTGRGRRAREWGVFGFGRVDAGLATLAFGASGGRLRDGEVGGERESEREGMANEAPNTTARLPPSATMGAGLVSLQGRVRAHPRPYPRHCRHERRSDPDPDVARVEAGGGGRARRRNPTHGGSAMSSWLAFGCPTTRAPGYVMVRATSGAGCRRKVRGRDMPKPTLRRRRAVVVQ
ncbi:hypothetical protein B0H11DRAFT_690475 [Mycena galericulata]|nr:hypothetical protein B0H11DRAFT_690475 [Mycena galericulata]